MPAGDEPLLGSMSKSLAPALRIGWVVTPPQLLPALRRAKYDDDFGTNALDQYVLSGCWSRERTTGTSESSAAVTLNGARRSCAPCRGGCPTGRSWAAQVACT